MTTKPLGHEIDGAGRRYYDDVVLDNILDAGFTGAVYVVHSEAQSVRGLPTHRTRCCCRARAPNCRASCSAGA